MLSHHTATPRRLLTRDWLIASIIAAVVVLCAGARLVPGVTGVFHDDAVYVANAKALASGDGYRLINLPDSPRQTKYPILYPALLAAVWFIWPSFPDNIAIMQWLSVLSGAAFFGLCYLYVVRFGYAEPVAAAAAVLLCGTAPLVLYFSTLTLSEMPFALLLVLGLWRLETELGRIGPSRIGQLTTGIIIGLPFLCRTIGLSVVAAGLLLLLLQRRPMVWVTLGALAVLLPWLAWASPAWNFDAGSLSAYYTDYSVSWMSSTSQLGQVAVTNLLLFLYLLWSIPLAPVVERAFGSASVFWVGFGALSVVTCRGMIRNFLAARPLGWLLVFYVLVTTVWPWPPGRFLVPILPLLAVCLTSGLAVITRSPLARRSARSLCLVAAALGMATNVAVTASQARENAQSGYPSAATTGARVNWRSFEESFSWIRANTRTDDVLAAGLDSMMFLYTGRQSIRPFRHQPAALFYGAETPATGTVEDLIATLSTYRVAYLVHTPMPFFSEEQPFALLILAARRQYPDALELVYLGEDPRFMVFRFNPRDQGRPSATSPARDSRSVR